MKVTRSLLTSTLLALGVFGNVIHGLADEGHGTVQAGGPAVTTVDVSVDILTSVGTSSANAEELETLQGGGHDPKRDGFTLQQAELSLSGVVDQLFTGQANIIANEEHVEVEEAFLTTLSLPSDLQLKAGYFLTEFGRNNPSHPHTWGWIDQPVINTRIFGGEGMRGAGARVSMLLPVPWYSEVMFGAQNADGEFMTSFLGGEQGHDHGDEDHAHAEEHEHAEEDHAEEEHAEEGHDHEHEHEAEAVIEEAGYEPGVAGRPIVNEDTDGELVYLGRILNSADLSDEWTGALGFSVLNGPNFTGDDADTWIYGTDVVLTWIPEDNTRGRPFLKLEAEVIYRDLEAAEFSAVLEDGDAIVLPSETLEDWGTYVQVIYGFRNQWSVGLRYEYATADGESVGGTDHDPYRCDRIRISPLLAYQPSEFSRVRLQYNYDDADYLEDGDANSIWLAFEILFGKHPAHKY